MYIDLKLINEKVSKDPALFIKECDSEYFDSINKIAENIIAQNGAKPIIVISGPSGSGKTTTALTLERILDEAGHETHTLSIDDFFFPMTEQEKELHRQSKMNLESPDRVDSDLLGRTLMDIIDCKPVYLSRFDFKTNSRYFDKTPLVRKPSELVVIEGTHALNPDVITISDDKTVRIYVSVRTRVHTEAGKMLHPEYIRLLRRMLRDKVHRDRSFSDTAKMYKSVQAGENKYIMPYKYRSTFDVDTFIPYELCVYRDLIFEGLVKENLADKMPELIELLKDALPLDKSYITSSTSLINEFIK